MIKKYSQFISERLGVPAGNIEAARELLDIIIESLDSDQSIFANPETKLINSTDLGMDIRELHIENVEYEIAARPARIPKVALIGMSVSMPPSKREGSEFKFDKNRLGRIKLKMMLAAPPYAVMSDLKALFEESLPKYAGILSHELKHVYDKFMIGKELVGDVADYYSWSNVKTGIDPIDEAIYYMYVTSKAESMVRASELAGEIEEAKVKKSEFKSFLESNELYDTLKKIKVFSAESLKNKMMSQIDEIRSHFDGIPEDETDEEVVRNVIESAYRSILGESGEAAENIYQVNGMKTMLLGAKTEDQKAFMKFIIRRSFRSGEEYFDYMAKEMRYQAEQTIKKIVKLYDYCLDDAQDPLMAKISNKERRS